ncbi:MAG: ECF transporter S component [Coriobacteriia bacterium]|nr:ECF transporter S component [Coriobacteriia bacterium]
MSSAAETKVLAVLEPVLLVAVPVVLVGCAAFNVENTALLTLLTVTAALVPFFFRFEKSHPKPRDIMPIVVLAAMAAVGRIIFAPFPDFKPVTAIVIVAAVTFGKESGFLVGALSALASNMFFGQGPWTPWQMYAWGLIGYLAGVLYERGFFERKNFVYVYGFVAAIFYGFILDSWYIVGFINPLTMRAVLLGYGAGLPFSLIHATSTVLFLIPLFGPWTRKLARIKVKYGLVSAPRDSE